MSGKNVSVWRFIARRIAFMIPTVLIVISVIFVLIHLAPGDPVKAFSGEVGITPEYAQFLREKWGLNQPLYVQYFTYIKLLLSGDLGSSLYFRTSVFDLILARIPATLLLVASSTVFSVVIGLLLGVLAARKPYGVIDHLSSTLSLVGYSMPVFWTGQLLLMIFSLNFGWLPYGGMTTVRQQLTGIAYLGDLLLHLILPTITLGLYQVAVVAQITRTGLLEALNKNFVKAERAKGLPERTIVFVHGLRDALVMVVTIVGLNIGRIVAGAVLTEITFSWPGLGRLLFDAVNIRDYPLVLGVFVFISSSVVLINFLVDVTYALIDPRIRHR